MCFFIKRLFEPFYTFAWAAIDLVYKSFFEVASF